MRSPKSSFGQNFLVDPNIAGKIADLATSSHEDLLDEGFAAHGVDRRQEARGQAAVVRREELLRLRRDVVEVARPADAVTDRLTAHESRGLEGPELLQDTGPTRADGGRELVRRRRTVASQADEDLAAKRARRAG